MKLRKILLVIIPIVLLFSNINLTQADELSDILSKINKANSDISAKSNQLNSIKNQISNLQSQTNTVGLSIDELNTNISTLQNQITSISNDLLGLQTELTDINLKIDSKKKVSDELVKSISILEHKSTLSALLESGGLTKYYNSQAIFRSNILKQNEDMQLLQSQIGKLLDLQSSTDTLKSNLGSKVSALNIQKSQFENQKAYLLGNIAGNQNYQYSLKSSIASLKGSVSLLTQQQKQIEQQQEFELSQGGSSGTVPIPSGLYYFTGNGRTLYDGHGVGMSQWGAYGMALNFGFSADKILKFYYTGVDITLKTPDRKVVVDNGAPMSVDAYLSGIGEVPNNWPQEAINAEIIAARTYLYRHASIGSDGNYHICGSDSCQVYLGGTAKQKFVDATKDKIITYDGSPIEAVYSAFHVGHSEDNDKVFDSISGGGGYPLPYLRGVDDSAFAFKPSYPCPGSLNSGICSWRTNGYTFDQLSTIFNSDKTTSVGKLTSIVIQRGSSQRAWKVTLSGSDGVKTVAGWYFQSVYNNWAYYNQPSGQRDYLYSTSLYFLQKQ